MTLDTPVVVHWLECEMIDPSWGEPTELFLVPASASSTTGVT